MKKKLLLILMISCYFAGFSQSKLNLNVDLPVNQTDELQPHNTGRMQSSGIEYATLENEKSGFSLLSDGYFTIGTTNGISGSTLDDNCQITFGHPFALTSYSFFSIDDTDYHPETFFWDKPKELMNQGDTLLGLQATDLNTIEYTFNMIKKDDGDVIRLNLTIKNIDNVAHNIGMGLMFDPAMGLWGDGAAFIDGHLISEDTLLQSNIPQAINIWERAANPSGMGVQMANINNMASTLMLGNWFNLHNNTTDTIRQIYDLGIKTEWSETVVDPNSEVSFTIDITLLTPDFPDGPFMRTDLPYFLSIENNLLFPTEVKSLVKIANNSSNYISEATLEVPANEYVNSWNTGYTISIPEQSTVYENAILRFPEIYRDMVATLELNLMEDNEIADQIQRTLFVPAAPFSDVGLDVTIDSLITSEFPDVSLIFKSQIEETGQYLLTLTHNNVFFYENELEITDYTLAKDTSGGVNEADIIFVLDVTGSMGNEINEVKENIVEFTDSLTAQNVDFQLGMVTFLDEIENVYEFTDDVQLFQEYVNQQFAHGGGDMPENSLEALMAACQFEFRPEAKRVFIWITDASYHINNQYTSLTPQDVVDEMLYHSVDPSCIGNTTYQLDYYNQILFPTGGDFYDINGNFRDILLEISRLNGSNKFVLSYTSNNDPGVMCNDVIEVHYAGLGGYDSVSFVTPSKALGTNDEAIPRYYPNPFSSATSIEIDNPHKKAANIVIYNIQGQQVAARHFKSGSNVISYTWNAGNSAGTTINEGLYFVHCELYSADGRTETLPVMKLVYMKQ